MNYICMYIKYITTNEVIKVVKGRKVLQEQEVLTGLH